MHSENYGFLEIRKIHINICNQEFYSEIIPTDLIQEYKISSKTGTNKTQYERDLVP
jgi:beta-lactamase class D